VAAQGGVALLLRILGRSAGCRDSRSVVRATNGALRALTGSEANRQALMSAGAVAQLVEVLDSNPPPEAAESAALALWDLAVSGANAAAMGAAGGIPALVALLASHRPGTRHAAVGALHNLAFADGNKVRVMNSSRNVDIPSPFLLYNIYRFTICPGLIFVSFCYSSAL
jgi:hypothetical protein